MDFAINKPVVNSTHCFPSKFVRIFRQFFPIERFPNNSESQGFNSNLRWEKKEWRTKNWVKVWLSMQAKFTCLQAKSMAYQLALCLLCHSQLFGDSKINVWWKFDIDYSNHQIISRCCRRQCYPTSTCDHGEWGCEVNVLVTHSSSNSNNNNIWA